MSRKDERLLQLRGSVPELRPHEALSLQQNGAVLVDVREPDETAAGSPPGALRLVRGFLELRIEESVPGAETTLLVMCAGGVRSLFAAEGLRQMGYRDVRSVAGGFNAWKEAGLPIEVPRVLGDRERERYGRHLLIPEVGEEGRLLLYDALRSRFSEVRQDPDPACGWCRAGAEFPGYVDYEQFCNAGGVS